MPVTRGSGNPNWTWDETLLALDMLYRRGALGRSHPEVIALSATLKAANLFPIEGRKDNFRNADGVALKLQNLMSAIDPKRGLSASATDRGVVVAFPQSRASELARVARNIAFALSNDATIPDVRNEEEAQFIEGRVLTARHRSRDIRLRRSLLRQTPDVALTCELCMFRPRASLSRQLRESFFETHHVIPLSASIETRATKISDLALLCAGCHRFLHKVIAQKHEWLTIEQARAVLNTG